MNSERRTVALTLVQQTVIDKYRCEINELHGFIVLPDIKEIEDDQLCIRIYNHEKSNSIIIARDNISVKVTANQVFLFNYLRSIATLFGAHARGERLRIYDKSDPFNFDMFIEGDNNYRLFTDNACYNTNNMHVSVIDKICKALYAFMNRLPIN
jgi:hypothetical protein